MKKQMEMVAKLLRKTVRCKTAVIKGQDIEFFTGIRRVMLYRCVVDTILSLFGTIAVRSLVRVRAMAVYLPPYIQAVQACFLMTACGEGTGMRTVTEHIYLYISSTYMQLVNRLTCCPMHARVLRYCTCGGCYFVSWPQEALVPSQTKTARVEEQRFSSGSGTRT